MPFFKTTYNIVTDQGEHFDSNWMDSDTLQLPPSPPWDYGREMQIEDVDLWEIIYEENNLGVYAAWAPHAEFYLIKPPQHMLDKGHGLETYYGPKASERVYKRVKEFGITLPLTKNWVEPDQMWLY